MSLQDLPPDALCEITSWLEGDDLYRLWTSGCKGLKLRLSEGGVTRYVYERPPMSSKALPRLFWPSVTSSFRRLKLFTLYCTHRETQVAITGADLTTLPATLESLTLKFQTSLQAWYDALVVRGTAFPNLRKLEIHSMEDKTRVKTIQALQWPKMLNSLTIWFDRLSVDLSALPPNLTYFKSGLCSLTGNDDAKFPSTLTELDLFFEAGFAFPRHILSKLPIGLLHLRLGRCYEAATGVWNWAELPPQLESLEIGLYNVRREHFAQLPKTLTSISDVSGNLEDFLETSLPNLTYATYFIPRSINRRTAMRLPRKLAFWVRIPEPEPDAIPHLPMGVRTAECRANDLKPLVSELASMHLNKIPVPLETLVLHSCVGLPSLTVLPDSLRYLSICNGPLPLPAMEYFEGLNSINLTTLDIRALRGNDTIAPENWDRLPKTLTSLIISIGDSLPVYSSALLPRSLRDIELSSETTWDLHSDWFQNLPIRMSEVSLDKINRIKCPEKYESMMAKDGDATATGPLGSVFEFPRYLEMLSLTIDGDVSDSAPWIFACIAASLPKHVNHYRLKLPHGAGGKLSNDELAMLPSGCNYVCLAGSSMFQTN